VKTMHIAWDVNKLPVFEYYNALLFLKDNEQNLIKPNQIQNI
jgi:hypothetical protein